MEYFFAKKNIINKGENLDVDYKTKINITDDRWHLYRKLDELLYEDVITKETFVLTEDGKIVSVDEENNKWQLIQCEKIYTGEYYKGLHLKLLRKLSIRNTEEMLTKSNADVYKRIRHDKNKKKKGN